MMMALRARGVRVVVWGQGYSRHRLFRPDRRFRDWLHLLIVRASDAYVCYTEAIRETLSRHVPADKLFVARNTLDTERLVELRRGFEQAGRESIRSELGLHPQGDFVAFIGRLQARKRPEVLLEAQRLLRDEGVRFEVLFIGDGPMRPELEARASELGLDDSVRFVGECYGDEAARYLFASDVMAMPGWLGLAVVHAFAMGVPVVSQLTGKQDLIGHPPEAAYVCNGVNGRMADPGGPREFAAALKSVLADRAHLGRGAAEFAARELSLDGMVDGFVAALSHATG
jgi:glycosyltransferase involved in cell wall biosynthesis